MAKLTLSDLSSLSNQTSAISSINANYALIETALENTLSRDGTTPNDMSADLDMDSNRILNLPAPVANTEPLRLVDGQPLVDAAEDARDAALAALDSFTDIYLGRLTGNPTTDLDGNTLQEGTLYYNTVSHQLRVYSIGTGWVAVAPFTDLAAMIAYVAAAAASASAASSSAGNASASATTATTQAGNASTSAGAAAVSALAALGSQTAAAASKTAADADAAAALVAKLAAQAAQLATELVYDSFDDRYLGAKSSPPALDNDGYPLNLGTIYYDTSSGLLKFYNGVTWVTLTTAAGLSQVQDDLSPDLGGNLTLSGYNVVGTGNINITGTGAFTGAVTVPDDAYAVGWNASTAVPTKNAVYDKIELVLGTTLPGAYQPLDSDLTAIAALTTTSYGRSLLALASSTSLAAEVDPFFLTPTEGNAAYQPLDSDLTAIAALTTTSYGRALLALADAAALRTAGGLVIGTDIEAHDADLTTIAGLTPTNDDIIQRKAGAWTNRTVAQLATDLALAATYQPLDSDLTAIAALSTTAAGRSVLAYVDPNVDAVTFWDDSAGAFAGLTLPTGLSISGTTLSFVDGPRGVSALVDGATPALDASLGNVFTLAAAGDRTIAVPSNATNGQKIVIRHLASGGARTLALNTGASGFRYGTDITALTQTVSGKTDYIGCIYSSIDSKWDVVAYCKGF